VKQLTVGLGFLVAALGSLALLVASAKFIGVSLGIVKLIKHFKDLASASRLARDATKTIGEALVPTATIGKPITPQQLGLDLSKKFQGYQLPLELDLVTPKIPPIKADLVPEVPPSAMSRLMGSLGGIGRALRGLIADVALFGVRLLGLIPGVGRLGAAFAGLRIGATIAGWLGAVGPFTGAFTAAMGGLLAWMTGTFLPAMVGIFSGPVGWIVLGVAALVAGMIYFREPIMKFFEWALGEVGKFWKNIFDFIYNTQVKPWVDLWTNVLQKPITQFIGWLWKVTEPVRNLFVNLGTIASEGIKFIFRLFDDILIKPLLSLAEWAFKGLIQLGYTVFVQPWISLWGAVKKPLADLWEWLATSAKVAFDALIQLGYAVFIEPWVKLWDAIKKPMADLWQWLRTTAQVALDALINIGYDLFIKPWVELWDKIKKPISTLYGWIQSGIKKTFEEINKFGNEKFIKPWGELWDLITEEPDKFQKKVKGWFDTLYDGIIEKWKAIPALFQNIWYNVTGGMSRAWNWMINGVVGKLNEIIGLWNRVAQGVNKLPTQFKLPIIPEFVGGERPGFAAREQIPGFARGGWVSRPTIAQLGEGGDPGGEYAIPAGRMDAAMAAWMQGVRGPALVQAWQSSPSPTGSPAAAPLPGSYGAAPQVTLQVQQTGPVMQMPDGSQWIRRDEAMALLQSSSRATLAAVDLMNRSTINRFRYGGR
jgi:hypothetical protein